MHCMGMLPSAETGFLHASDGQYFSIKSSACSASLVPRPSAPPVFDHLQYAKTEGEGLGSHDTQRS